MESAGTGLGGAGARETPPAPCGAQSSAGWPSSAGHTIAVALLDL